jgi:hypothetical protein
MCSTNTKNTESLYFHWNYVKENSYSQQQPPSTTNKGSARSAKKKITKAAGTLLAARKFKPGRPAQRPNATLIALTTAAVVCILVHLHTT